MKQRKCTIGKVGGCWDYGGCDNCEINRIITKYERKIKRLKAKIEKLEKEQK